MVMLSSAQTKELIKRAALTLMQTTDPDKITAVELARKAEISRATFYRHYDTVDDVLREIEDEFINGIRACCENCPKAPLNTEERGNPPQVFYIMTEYILEHRDVYLVMTGAHEDARFLVKWRRFIREFHSDMLSLEKIGKRDAELFIELLEAGMDAIIRYWLEKRPDAEVGEITHITERLLWGLLLS